MSTLGKWSRRNWLRTSLAGVTARQLALGAQVSSKTDRSKLAMPGLYRGRVVAIGHPASIVEGKFQAEPIRQMISKGMLELTGAPDLPSAWKQFVEPGDVVGIVTFNALLHRLIILGRR